MALVLFALLGMAGEAIRPPITDTIWVYERASDPGSDPFVRVWGSAGEAVPKSAGEASELGFGLMQWDVSKLQPGRKLTSAKLTVTSIADPKYTADQARQFPLQARATKAGFAEKSWKYDQLGDFLPKPEKDAVFGGGSPSPFPKPEAEFSIVIDLLKGPGDFRAYLAAAESGSKQLALALTTLLDVQINSDTQTIYKFYSRHAPKEEQKPVLELTFE